MPSSRADAAPSVQYLDSNPAVARFLEAIGSTRELAIDTEGRKRFGVRRVVISRAAVELQATLVRVINRDQGDAVVAVDVSRGNELPVARGVGPCDVATIDDLDEPCWAAAVLDVWPAIFTDRCEVEAVALRQERALELTKLLRCLVCVGVVRRAARTLLPGAGITGERDIGIALHGNPFVERVRGVRT